MKTGRYDTWLSTVAGQMLTGSDLGTKHVHYRWCVVHRHVQLVTCQRARHWLGSAQNCPGPTGLQRSVYTLGAKEFHRWLQSSIYGTVWAFLLSIGHVTLIKESSFGAETWLITQNLKQEKGCVIEKLSTPSSKENGSIVISKDDHVKLSWGYKHDLVVDFFLTMVTLSVDCHCSTLSLRWPFFVKGLRYIAKILSFYMKMPGVTHPTGQVFMAVHLRGYGSVQTCAQCFISHWMHNTEIMFLWFPHFLSSTNFCQP